MTSRTYRTARGKTIDLGALALRQSRTRSVGNTKTNAAGDVVDSFNNVVQTSAERAQSRYKQRTNVTEPQPQPQPSLVQRSEVPLVNRLTADTDVTSGDILNVDSSQCVVTDDPAAGFAAALKRTSSKTRGQE